MLMGSVSKTRMGFITALKMPRTSATTSAVWKESMWKPLIYWEIRNIVSAESSQLAKIFVINKL